MRSGLGPIYPSDASVQILLGDEDIHQCWNIVLVHVPRGFAEFPQYWLVLLVWYDLDGQAAVELEPLAAFAPLIEIEIVRKHFGVVPAATHFPGIVC
ncbi:hypothetical protein SLA2020_224820 [Shorea laevis]